VWTLKPTGAGPIDNTTFYAALIINSNIGHGEYMQPGWFFCVNCHGRYFAGDAPNGLAGVGPVPSTGRPRPGAAADTALARRPQLRASSAAGHRGGKLESLTLCGPP
jgi:hypothetical protein